MDVLRRRAQLVKHAQEVKRAAGFPVRDPGREGRMFQSVVQRAEGYGPDTLEKVWGALFEATGGFWPPFLLGESPSADGSGAEVPFDGKSGARLAGLLGVDRAKLPELFDLANLLPEWPGPAGKGSAFPMQLARTAAAGMAPRLAGRRVVFVGKRVASAFRYRADYLAWGPVVVDGHRFMAATLPHPSGINRWWNEPGNTARASAFLHEVTS